MESTGHQSLSADIVYYILLGLSVKTLTRFRCVCKSWSILISSTQFQNHHSRRAQENPLLLVLESVKTYDNASTVGFSVYDKNIGTLVKKFSKRTETFPRIVIGTVRFEYIMQCRGLVCISTPLQGQPILLCNPSTEEMICLPCTEEVNFCVGFGYATSTEQFKLVRFFYKKRNSSCEVLILGNRHWRKARTPPPYHISGGTPSFVQGSLHFLPLRCDLTGIKDYDYIAAFNIDTEDYKRIMLPNYYYSLAGSHIANLKKTLHLANLRGVLCLTMSFGEVARGLELWLLKDYANVDWAKGYYIDLSSVICYPSDSSRAYLIDNVADDSILLTYYYKKDVKVLSYNPKDGTVTVRKDKARGATFYVETFYPLRST